MRLEGKVAFVTGASRGIGAAVARALSNEGVAVGLASRSGDDLGLANALGLACDVARHRPGRGRRRCDGRALRPPRHLRRERRRRLVPHARRHAVRAPRGDDRRQPQGDDLRRARLDPAPRSRAAAATSSPSPRRPGGAGCRARPSTAPRSSARSASRERSTTSCASTASAARTSAPAASRPTSRSRTATGDRPTSSRG